ncbi:carbon-monoxide dehydrogenase medium subunit [Streptosporangium becharense]|uniref:Carbon-monoxide dehydrogenase medium subunit n=1 Tax=Streptosporangium becharense TaxID=1816182 RepID=A0A7W9IFF2_9ACTN|nr:xanthine dehydrogenase family protein subunit M [Streptosporangium becharense]MBB2909543.1 carbon-monoxide dehydrogenase medium subunit [Streptosporangium becharense]MBB5819500.1 carbon-monoxide dehydrogenase medium subunit [Streptosporangium becharense]
MIPASFDYIRPESLQDACRVLGEAASAGDDVKALAGGQSLLPLLRLRLAYPAALVDLGRLPELRGVEDRGDHVFIGALTTHDEVVRSRVVREKAPLFALATATVADPAVRHRGTFGGSMAHADPAGDLPAVAVALDCVFVVRSGEGEREIPAAEFFVDYLEPALEPGEVLVGVRVPVLGAGWGFHYEKFHRTAQSWAIVGVAAAVRKTDGAVEEARIGLTNMGPTPVRAEAVETALRGVDLAPPATGGTDPVREACAEADDGTSPPADLHAQPDYRRHLARVLTARAVRAAGG